MILQGNQRGGAKDLAAHLLKDENEHVEVHDLRGFVSDDLGGALNEAYAVSKGTKAKQFLFSLSLNPPPEEKVSTASFEDAISRVEDKLGLSGQPRAIVFHEKNGRRHCHTVWSRTDSQAMKAIPLPHTKRKLMEISRELYVEHGWNMPRGMINSDERDPRNFTLAEWQQAKRIGKDPRAIKQVFQDCWAMSDNHASFENALKSRGYFLAKGDRRGFVALDHRCEVFAVAKWVGIKTKDVRAKLDNEADLRSVSDVKIQIASDMGDHLKALQERQNSAVQDRLNSIDKGLVQLTQQHKDERQTQTKQQTKRWTQETKARQSRYRKGMRGLWDRITGRYKQIREENERETEHNRLRDRQEKDAQIFQQLSQRITLQKRLDRLQNFKDTQSKLLSEDVEQYQEIKDHKLMLFKARKYEPFKSKLLGLKVKL